MNAAALPGNNQPPAPVALTAEQLLKCTACTCDAQVQAAQPNLTCMRQGTVKHDCCETRIQQHRATGQPPRIDGEHGYMPGAPPTPVAGTRMANFQAGTLPRGSLWPDAAVLDANGNITKFIDFKFKCAAARYQGPPTWSRRRGVSQGLRYHALNQALNPNSDPPEVIHNQGCPPNHACPP